MTHRHSSAKGATPKRLSLEQKIRLIARRFRTRERRHGRQPADPKHAPRRWWMAFACALALLATMAGPTNARAEDYGATFDQANQAYSSGRFADSVRGYEAVIAKQGFSAPLLFNLGNAWLKAGEPGRAILNYERAQWLAPGDRAIATNLRLARQQAGLPVAEQNNLEKAARMLGFNTLAWVGSAALVLLCAGILGSRLLRSGSRVEARVLTSVGAVVLAVVLANLAWRWPDLDRAVVLAASVPARIAPADAAGVSFNLSAGEIVHTRQTHGAFTLLRARDGRTGWVSRRQVAQVIVAAVESSRETSLPSRESY